MLPSKESLARQGMPGSQSLQTLLHIPPAGPKEPHPGMMGMGVGETEVQGTVHSGREGIV